VRQRWDPPLAGDEQTVLQQQGAYLSGRSWKLGHLYLTDRRLLFSQAGRLALDLSLDDVTRLDFTRRPFILATKTCLRLSYHTCTGRRQGDGAHGRSREATIITADLPLWTQRLAEELTSQGVDFKGPESLTGDGAVAETSGKQVVQLEQRIGMDDLEQVAAALDPASGELIWYLWEHGHARIEDLRQVVGAPSHMHVLTRIRETINPVARRTLGQPLLVFEPRRTDLQTGEVVAFSWWLCREAERLPDAAPPADVFDEGQDIVVVAELGGVKEDEIRVQVEGKQLIVAVGDRPTWKIALPAAVNRRGLTHCYRNNVLQVRLEKEARST